MRILLVEDHEDSRRATATLLQLLGHEVVSAEDAKEAIAAVDDRLDGVQPAFDVALIDLGLPESSGLDLLRDLQERSKICGIALTGRTGSSAVAEAKRAGFKLYLTKPVSIDELERGLSSVDKIC